MPETVYITDRERVQFLKSMIPSLSRVERLREDFWELVFDMPGDVKYSMNVHINVIKKWTTQEGFPKQWAKQSKTELGQ